MITLSAADSEILEECPKWERLKYAAFGASILVPFLFGMIASAYAISTLTENKVYIGGFALVWGFIIITVDRVLLSTYRAFVPFHQKVAQFVLRITVAVLMGLTVSHPLTLLLFKDTIISEIERERIEQMAAAREATDKEKKELDTRILQAVENLQKQEKRYEEVIAGGFLNNQPAAAPAPVQTIVNTHSTEIEAQIKEYKRERDQVQIDLNRFQRTYDEEISGARTGKPGIGPNARAIERDELVWRREEVKRLGGVIADLTRSQSEMSAKLLADSTAANAVIEASKRQLEQQKIQLFASQQGQMVEVVKGQIASASAELDRLREEAKKLSLDSNERVEALKGEKRMDLMVQTQALHKIFKNEGGVFALAVYIVIGSLFTLIDIIPLVVKFFAVPGIYDYYQELKETGKAEKPNVEVDKIVTKIDAKAASKESAENPDKTQEEAIKLKSDLITKEIEKILNSSTLSAFDKLDQIESIRLYQPKTKTAETYLRDEVATIIMESDLPSLEKLNLITSTRAFEPDHLSHDERKKIISQTLEKVNKAKKQSQTTADPIIDISSELVDNKEASEQTSGDSKDNVIPVDFHADGIGPKNLAQTGKRQESENHIGAEDKEGVINKPAAIKPARPLPKNSEVAESEPTSVTDSGDSDLVDASQSADRQPPILPVVPLPEVKVNKIPRGIKGSVFDSESTKAQGRTSDSVQAIVPSPFLKSVDPRNDFLEEHSEIVREPSSKPIMPIHQSKAEDNSYIESGLGDIIIDKINSQNAENDKIWTRLKPSPIPGWKEE